jgi:organic radical activating enzyme
MKCALAWTGLFFGPNQTVKPCCRFKESVNSQIKTNELKSLQNSPFQELRISMNKSQWSTGCIRCKEEEDSGKKSLREIHNDFMNLDNSLVNFDSRIKFIEFSDSNVCNLKCRMCGPDYSSKWIEDWESISSIKWHKNEKNDESLVDKINWKEIEYLKFTGGEPFLIPKTKIVLDHLIKSSNCKNINLNFSTNMTVKLDESMLNILSAFKSVEIVASIDGVGAVNDFIRHGSRWTEIEKNFIELLKILNEKQNFKVGVRPTVSVYNILNMPTLLSWIENKANFYLHEKKIIKINPTHLSYPEFLSTTIFPKTNKTYIQSRVHKDLENINLSENSKNKILSLLSHMMSRDDSHLWGTFKIWTQKVDVLRSENTLELEPVFKTL